MCKRKSVVICIVCDACSFNKVENVIYEYIEENWAKNWTLWHALNGGFQWTVHVTYPDTLLRSVRYDLIILIDWSWTP